jgi:hypothetical protein
MVNNRTIWLYNEDLGMELPYDIPQAVFDYISDIEESETVLAITLERTLEDKLQIHMN